MKIDPLNKSKKKKFLEEFSGFGDFKTKALLIKTGKEKIRAYTGILSNEEIWDFWRIFPVEGIGVYVGRENMNSSGVKEVRLGMEGMSFFKDQIKDNILVLDESQEEKWFLGKDVEVGGEQVDAIEDGFVILKSKESNDFIGIGKLNKDKDLVHSYMPKERRRKESGLG